jgi:hypothetical protein
MHLFPVPGLSGRDVVSYVVCVFPVGSLLARVHIEMFPIVFAFSLSRWYFFQKTQKLKLEICAMSIRGAIRSTVVKSSYNTC